MKIGNRELPISGIVQFGGLVAMLVSALAWADGRYLLTQNFQQYAIQSERRAIETQLEILDEKKYQAERQGDTGRAAELKRRYKLIEKRLDRVR